MMERYTLTQINQGRWKLTRGDIPEERLTVHLTAGGDTETERLVIERIGRLLNVLDGLPQDAQHELERRLVDLAGARPAPKKWLVG